MMQKRIDRSYFNRKK